LCPDRGLDAGLLSAVGVAAAKFIPAAETAMSVFACSHLATVMATVGDGGLKSSSLYHIWHLRCFGQ